ncbi:MAG: RagB/SusD family nutrient uptake outer membrane protein, partial [Bacteroidota bacterium]
MKIREITYGIIIGCIVLLAQACNEDEFLEEVNPGEFTTDNAFTSEAGFQSAIWWLYGDAREYLYEAERRGHAFQAGTDLFHVTENMNELFHIYSFTTSPSRSDWQWIRWYKMVSNANLILAKLDEIELDVAVETRIEAEARFFRAFAYRIIGGLYGNAPLILEAVTEAKNDFEQSPQEEIYAQVVADFEFAAQNLPGITEVSDAQVSDLTAYHALSEAYLAIGDYGAAEAAASVVINDPNTALMTERFGSLAGEPGDVFYDLFRIGNQNRSTGNTESLWVIQQETDVPGGANVSNRNRGARMERVFAPLSRGLFAMDQNTRELITDDEGNPVSVDQIWPVSTIGGGGRGIGWLAPTLYVTNTIWEDVNGDIDFNDIRTSWYNLPRRFPFNNPESPFFNDTLYVETPEQVYDFVETIESVSADTEVWKSKGLWPRGMYPYFTKVTTPGQHPENLVLDPVTRVMEGFAGARYGDIAKYRLAETYLLRAEARLQQGNTGGAAEDINVVRNRANA